MVFAQYSQLPVVRRGGVKMWWAIAGLILGLYIGVNVGLLLLLIEAAEAHEIPYPEKMYLATRNHFIASGMKARKAAR